MSKIYVYSGHYILPAMPKGSASTSLGPIFCDHYYSYDVIFCECIHNSVIKQGYRDWICQNGNAILIKINKQNSNIIY